MKLISFLLLSIGLMFMSCNDCDVIECPENKVYISFVLNPDNHPNGINSDFPDVKFAIGKEVFSPSSAPGFSGSILSFEQTFSPGIAIVDYLGKKDTIELIKPIFNRKTDCCTLPFSDTIIVNKTIRMPSQNAILFR